MKIQESALVIARLLVPQLFEKMSMHEIRVLIAERSTMNIYIKGEDIEIEQNYIGILLEGYMRTADSKSLITAPGVLLPSNSDWSLFGLESSAMDHVDYCYTAPSYQVDARARILLFEIVRTETEADMQRTVSLLSQTHEAPRTPGKEHSALLSWPESFKRRDSIPRSPRRPNMSLSETRNHPGSFSSKALQWTMYGGMVDDMLTRHRRHTSRTQTANQAHSSSYPRLPSRPSLNTRPLLSVRSEGSNMKKMAAANEATAPATPAG